MNLTHTKRMRMLAVSVFVTAIMIQGCGGGGGSRTTTVTPTTALKDATIAGKVSIEGIDNCAEVVVIAEQVDEGVTRTVALMIEAAKAGKRISQRVAADTPGVYIGTTNDECEYEISLPADTYSVAAVKEDTVGAQLQRITARSAAVVTVNFELVATGSVSGTALIGVVGEQAVVVWLDGTSFAAYASITDGSFTISNVPVGTYTLVFSRAGTIYGASAGIAVAAGATTSSASTSISITCAEAEDCDDGDVNTGEVCTDAGTTSSVCTNPPIECFDDTGCDDSDTYTVDECTNPGVIAADCVHIPVACFVDADCDDGDATTTDLCLNGGVTEALCSNSPPEIPVHL